MTLAVLIVLFGVVMYVFYFTIGGPSNGWRLIGSLTAAAGFLLGLLASVDFIPTWQQSAAAVCAALAAVALTYPIDSREQEPKLKCLHSGTNSADRQNGYLALDRSDVGDSGVTLCDVKINNGAPIERTYTLEGTLFGNLPEDKEISLLRKPDAGTCTTDGHPGTGNYFYSKTIDFVPDNMNAWSRDVSIQFYERTLKYTYVIAITPKGTEKVFARAQGAWRNETGRKNGWPGMPQIPSGQILGTFQVQPEESSTPCRH
ncbi:hypothetical protein QD712_07620 [Streptomyces acidiscabies]|uniref:hypothetical protein n=1 Tax=Streptomyces acidiscabies TaxID=42234 RepID=UPI0030CC3940